MQCHCMKILDRKTKYNVQCLSCHSIALGKGITLVVCLVKASMFYRNEIRKYQAMDSVCNITQLVV